jgi:hypothetical protein
MFQLLTLRRRWLRITVPFNLFTRTEEATMEQMYGEMFKLWKFSWESYKNNLALMQQQAEKMLELFFSQSQSLQEGAQKNVKDMLATAQKAQASYIQTMEDAFKKIEDIMAKR